MPRALNRNLIWVVFCVLLSGCVSIYNVQSTPKARVLFKKNNSMVFGRTISSWFEVRLVVKSLQSNRTYQILPPPRKALFSKHKQDNLDQYFFSFLPPGEYKIFRIVFGDGVTTGSIDTDMGFTVAENSAVYLGSFLFSWQTTKNYFFFSRGDVQYGVKDDRDAAIKGLWNRFPEFEAEKLNVVVSLIHANQDNVAKPSTDDVGQVLQPDVR